MKIINIYPAKPSRFSEPVTFLSLPGELRNQIYNLYFARDMYDSGIGWERRNRHLTKKRLTYFEILLASHQIYEEALSIAKYEYTRQLRLRRQRYWIPTEKGTSARKWELWSCLDWTPKCRDVFALAKLELPAIHCDMSITSYDHLKERLHRLRTFFVAMVEALQGHGATNDIEIYLPRLEKSY